ncbi:hypothetical protein [Haloprofundus salinisoli]|uniref:hypothetical protein n=1 Tax=Haloprofundus salinisoli TaxID=2876193 RepID=UPI001CCBBF3D|nr:hypothetical protein [Haloprofundus salinisoli]
MVELFGRRSILRAICGIVTGASAGCMSRLSTGQTQSPTPTSSPTKREESDQEQRNCEPLPTGRDGAPPPWFDPDSSADIEIDNGVQSDLEVVLTIDDDQKEISIPEGDHWLSDDIIDDGERPTITVATKNLEARLEWKGEQDNMGVATFVIREDTIDKRFRYKFCSKFSTSNI